MWVKKLHADLFAFRFRNHSNGRFFIPDLWFSILSIGLPLILYLRTMAPTVYGLDSAELTTGAYTLGIVHAPGSPLYLMLAHLFTYLPLGDIGYRVNLFSAVTAAATILNVFWILRYLNVSRTLALLVSWFLACTYYFWIVALFAELYALQGWFFTILLLLAFKWRKHNHPGHLYLFCLLFGAGLGNHLSLTLLAPGYALLFAGVHPRPWKRPMILVYALFCGVMGSMVYLYLPIRYMADPALNYVRDYWHADLTTWDGFWWMVTGQMFIGNLWGISIGKLFQEFFQYTYILWGNFAGVGFWIGLVGLINGIRRNADLHGALLLMMTMHLVFYLPYQVVDKALMWLPTLVIWGFWVGTGFEVIHNWLTDSIHQLFTKQIAPSAVMILLIVLLALNFGLVDLSKDNSARYTGENILSALQPGAAFFGNWGDIPILEYLQLVENQRTDIKRFNTVAMTTLDIQQTARLLLEENKPVYTSVERLFSSTEFRQEKIAICNCYQIFLAHK
jgi:hypothetical protein